jgi:hypothetical protein
MATAEQLEQWQGRHWVDAAGIVIGQLEDVYCAAGVEPVLETRRAHADVVVDAAMQAERGAAAARQAAEEARVRAEHETASIPPTAGQP